MRGGKNASYVLSEMRKDEYYRKKAIRQKCIVDNEKQCDKCKYIEICEDKEIKDEVD